MKLLICYEMSVQGRGMLAGFEVVEMPAFTEQHLHKALQDIRSVTLIRMGANGPPANTVSMPVVRSACRMDDTPAIIQPT